MKFIHHSLCTSQACAPLFHWNVQRGGVESGITPVGNCLILEHKTGNSTPFSPCRGLMMEEDYKRMHNSKKTHRDKGPDYFLFPVLHLFLVA